MLTIIDLGHKPQSSCYLIEIELYPHSEHKPIYILIDTPIEQNDLLDFIPNNVPNGFYFNTSTKQKYQNKTNWKLDDSGKQWMINNKKFKNSPFYATVPFKNVNIKNKSNFKSKDKKDRKTLNTNINSKKRQYPFEYDHQNHNNNNQHNKNKSTKPTILSKNKVFIDIVLISNHQSMLGLPYLFKQNHDNHHDENQMESLLSTDPITFDDIINQADNDDDDSKMEQKDDNDNYDSIEIFMSHHCKIYATEATKHYGKLLMKSLSTWQNNKYFTLNGNECDIKHNVYDDGFIDKCISSIISIEFNESVSIYGSSNEFKIICISSGLYIGSSNWIINGDGMQSISLGIVCGSCGATNRHPKSITLSPYFHQIGNIDVMLIDDLQSIQLNDESVSDSLVNIDKKIRETIANKGTIILPTSSIGIAYDILDQCYQTLSKFDNYGSSKIYFISSIANESISYSSIYGEYLHKNYMKQVIDAKYPFGFHSFIDKNRLIFGSNWDNSFCFKHISMSKLNEARIIICESPSLRYGNILHFLNIFNHPKNTLILTDPSFNSHLALYPFNNDLQTQQQQQQNEFSNINQLKLQIVSYPIDARLQIKELCVLLRKVAPRYAFIPNNYYQRIIQNMNKFISVNTLQLEKHLNQQQQKNQSVKSPNIMSPILLEKIKTIKYCTMDNGNYHCIQLNQLKKQKLNQNNNNNIIVVKKKKKETKKEKKKKDDNDDDTETFYFTKAFNNGDMKTLYIDSLISQNIYPKNINPNHSNNMFIASLFGNIDYNTNKNKLILRNKDFINTKYVVNKTFIGTLNINGFINNLKTNQTQFNLTNIQQTKPNIISFNINKNQNIKVLTKENITNIRSDSPLNKKNLALILDLVSKQLISF